MQHVYMFPEVAETTHQLVGCLHAIAMGQTAAARRRRSVTHNAPDQHTGAPQERERGASWWLLPAILLCTGTSVAVMGQVVNNQAPISPKAQLLVLARYVFTFAVSAALYAREQTAADRSSPAASSPMSTKVKFLLLLMGALDLASYGIFTLGFAACGSALSSVVLAASGQISTAFISVTMLHRKLTRRHVAAVTIVTVGLVLRSVDDISFARFGSVRFAAAAEAAGNSSRRSASVDAALAATTLYGTVCVMVSALLFSILGCMYEVLMNASSATGSRVTQAQASFTITGVSLLITLGHQLLFVLPHLQQLVLDPVGQSQQTPADIAAAHVLYGLITAAHQYVQVGVLGSHGAMAVGLVNAVRASLVSFVSNWLFCGAVSHLCITQAKAVSALVVTVGAALWVIAGRPITVHKGAPQAVKDTKQH